MMHYRRWCRTGDPGEAAPRYQRRDPVCTVEGCDRQHQALGLCPTHLTRYRTHGHPRVGDPVQQAPPRSWSISAWLVKHEGWDQDDEDTA